MSVRDDQVLEYQNGRIILFLKRIGLIGSILVTGSGLHALYLRSCLSRAEQTGEDLAAHHLKEAHRWHSLQHSSKKIKALKQELELLQSTPVTQLVKKLTENLPDTLLFHDLSYTLNEEISITGSAASAHELALYLLCLARKNIQVTITSSRPLAGGIAFTLGIPLKKEQNSCSRRKKTRTVKK